MKLWDWQMGYLLHGDDAVEDGTLMVQCTEEDCDFLTRFENDDYEWYEEEYRFAFTNFMPMFINGEPNVRKLEQHTVEMSKKRLYQGGELVDPEEDL